MIELFNNLCDPAWIMQHGGLYIIVAIIFAETGLFAGFFLPGDTLLFVAGIILAHNNYPFAYEPLSVSYWLVLIMLAGIAGNFVGYWFGRKSGAYLLERKDSFLFKKKHLMKAKEFYEQRGGGAIVIARFLPLVRTFAPIIAGMVQMDLRKFSLYNVIGSVAWVGSIVLAGYFLGNIPFVKENLEYIMLGIVLFTTLPVLLQLTGIKDRIKKWRLMKQPSNFQHNNINPVIISEPDYRILNELVGEHAASGNDHSLSHELNRAIVVKKDAFPKHTIGINSKVSVLDLESNVEETVTLVVPQIADVDKRLVSVLSPMGVALIGFRKEEFVSWAMAGSIKKYQITDVVNDAC